MILATFDTISQAVDHYKAEGYVAIEHGFDATQSSGNIDCRNNRIS